MVQGRDKKLLLRMVLVLKELRNEHGLSQEDVYNETSIHIGRIEAGVANPTLTTIAALTRFYNIKLSEFFIRIEKGV